MLSGSMCTKPAPRKIPPAKTMPIEKSLAEPSALSARKATSPPAMPTEKIATSIRTRRPSCPIPAPSPPAQMNI